MFTGIVEEIGSLEKIVSADVGSMTIKAQRVLADIQLGDSIAVNGVCLTVTAFTSNSFTVDVMAQTLRLTNLGLLKRDSPVNLERAMKADGRFGGHIVSGHVDEVGVIKNIRQEKNAFWYEIECSGDLMRFIMDRGSVAVDGTSLTVAEAEENTFCISMIPHTRRETVLGIKKAGDRVNLEGDAIAKYVERLLYFKRDEGTKGVNKTVIDKGFLASCGF